MAYIIRIISVFAALLIVAIFSQSAIAAGAHSGSHAKPAAKMEPMQNDAHDTHDTHDAEGDKKKMLDSMRKSHGGHEHGHDFEAMEKLTAAELTHVIGQLQDIGLVMPIMDAAQGRKIFVETGCVVCHSVNGVGGDIGPNLDAANMPSPMNAFEFAARMWRGAASMTAMQQDLFGDVISLDGQQLADLVAFAHDENEQKKLNIDQVPNKFQTIMLGQ